MVRRASRLSPRVRGEQPSHVGRSRPRRWWTSTGPRLLHYGYSRDEFLAMTVDDLCAEETPAATKAAQDSVARSGDTGGRTDRSSTWRSPRSRSRSAGGRPLWTPSSTSPTAGGRRPRRAISTSCWRRSTTPWSPATTSSSSRAGTPPPNRPTADGPKRCSDSRTRWCSAPTSSASSAPRRSSGCSRRAAFTAS